MTEPTAAERAARARRLAEVFGDVLPDQTRDDADGPAPHGRGDRAAEERLLREVPPHHGS